MENKSLLVLFGLAFVLCTITVVSASSGGGGLHGEDYSVEVLQVQEADEVDLVVLESVEFEVQIEGTTITVPRRMMAVRPQDYANPGANPDHSPGPPGGGHH